MNPINSLNLLHNRIREVAAALGLEVDEDYTLKVFDDQQSIVVRLHVLPEAFITEDDFEETKYNDEFKDIIGELL